MPAALCVMAALLLATPPDAPARTVAVDAGPTMPAQRPASAAVNTIDAVLGQLQTRDEVLLREPLLGMRNAEMTMLPRGDRSAAVQLSRSAAVFAARLEAATLPAGTRANLARLVAVYEHDALGMNEALLRTPHDADTARAAVGWEIVQANADADLRSGQPPVSAASDAASGPLRWLLGATLGVPAAMLAGGGFVFGRTPGFEHTLAQGWPSR